MAITAHVGSPATHTHTHTTLLSKSTAGGRFPPAPPEGSHTDLTAAVVPGAQITLELSASQRLARQAAGSHCLLARSADRGLSCACVCVSLGTRVYIYVCLAHLRDPCCKHKESIRPSQPLPEVLHGAAFHNPCVQHATRKFRRTCDVCWRGGPGVTPKRHPKCARVQAASTLCS